MPVILDFGGIRDRQAIALATSKNNRIPNARRPERPPEAMAEAMRFVQRSHPNVRLRSLTATYNCVGLAFASRRTCIEPDYVQMILDDDGYVETLPAEVMSGDVLIYRDRTGEVSHVAVVVSHVPSIESGSWRTTVLSQWGSDGEYLHDSTDVNEMLGKPDKFYSERRRARV